MERMKEKEEKKRRHLHIAFDDFYLVAYLSSLSKAAAIKSEKGFMYKMVNIIFIQHEKA